MQFSKRVNELSRLYAVEPKDVLFAMLSTAGASAAESFAVIYRPTVSTSAALATKASNYVAQRPGLRRLIKQLDLERPTTAQLNGVATSLNQTISDQPAKRRGRPRKDGDNPNNPQDDKPTLDYTDKDAVLQELARIAERCEKESDRLAAIREISSLQRMKQEAAIEDEKRVQFYIPLSYARAEELTEYLARYFAEKQETTPTKIAKEK